MNRQVLYRLWHKMRLWMIPSSVKRAKYIKEYGIFMKLEMAVRLWKEKFYYIQT